LSYDDEDDDDPLDWDDDDRVHDDPAIGDDDGREDDDHDDAYWVDDDRVPPKEEPDCYACNDSGCPACEPHTDGCDCADCANSHVVAHEFLQDLDAGLIQAGPFVDDPPF
jgi:hypothetical protein